MQTDMFGGIFDDIKSGLRIKICDNRLIAYVRAGIETKLTKDFGMNGEFGKFPPVPDHLKYIASKARNGP